MQPVHRNYAANLRSAFKGVEWAEEQPAASSISSNASDSRSSPSPKGYGHAVWCAREFIAGQLFLLLGADAKLVGQFGTTIASNFRTWCAMKLYPCCERNIKPSPP